MNQDDIKQFFGSYIKILSDLNDVWKDTFQDMPNQLFDIKFILPLLKGYISDYLRQNSRDFLTSFKDEINNYTTALKSIHNLILDHRKKALPLKEQSENLPKRSYKTKEILPVVDKYTKLCSRFIDQFLKRTDDFNKNFISVQFALLDEINHDIHSIRSLSTQKIDNWNERVEQSLQVGLASIKESKASMGTLQKQIENSQLIIEGKTSKDQVDPS